MTGSVNSQSPAPIPRQASDQILEQLAQEQGKDLETMEPEAVEALRDEARALFEGEYNTLPEGVKQIMQQMALIMGGDPHDIYSWLQAVQQEADLFGEYIEEPGGDDEIDTMEELAEASDEQILSLFGGKLPPNMSMAEARELLAAGKELGSISLDAGLPILLFGDEEELSREVESMFADLDFMQMDAPVFAAIITNLMAEVARVLREILAREAKLRGELIQAIVDTGIASAEQQYAMRMEEVRDLRQQAMNHMMKGIFSAIMAGIQVGMVAGSSIKTRRGRQAADRQLNEEMANYGAPPDGMARDQAALDAGLAMPDRSRLDASGSGGAMTPQQYMSTPQYSAWKRQHPNEAGNFERSVANHDQQTQLARREATEWLNSGIQITSQVINSANAFNDMGWSFARANTAARKAGYELAKQGLDLLTGVLEKMYQSSNTATSQITQALESARRDLESIMQSSNKIGGWHN